jgi:hypothetical protein
MEAGAGGRPPERDQDAGDESAPEGEGAPEGTGAPSGAEPAADATASAAGTAGGEGGEPPLKICRNCSVASRTDADACPSCGTPYERRRVGRPRRLLAWLAIPIIIAGFAIGYFGRKLIEGDPSAITTEQAAAVERGISRDQLIEQLGEPADEKSLPQGSCLDYALDDAEGDRWLFCFQDDALTVSRQVPG